MSVPPSYRFSVIILRCVATGLEYDPVDWSGSRAADSSFVKIISNSAEDKRLLLICLLANIVSLSRAGSLFLMSRSARVTLLRRTAASTHRAAFQLRIA